jgi:heptosyltransferase-2
VAHLVFQTAFPGDLFLSIPLLKRIQAWEPDASVTLACRPGLGEFFLRHGLVDEVIEIDKRSATGRRTALQKLAATSWDVIFVPHESPRTALWMRRLRAKRAKVGFRSWWNFPFYNRRVEKPVAYPDALRQLSLLTPLDSELAEHFGSEEFARLRSPRAQHSPFEFREPAIPEWCSMRLRPRLNPTGLAARRIFLAPGSVWPTKRWTAQGYEDLARLLLTQGYQVELVGSAGEKPLCDEIASHVNGVFNQAGQTTLSGLVDLFAQGGGLIANDSGAMHAAAVVGLPTVAIFGPTTLAQGFRPWQNAAIVVQRELSCRPCGKHGAEKCPIGTHECMTKISAAEVYAALVKVIELAQ